MRVIVEKLARLLPYRAVKRTAELLAIQPSTLSRYRSGARTLTFRVLERILSARGYDVRDWLHSATRPGDAYDLLGPEPWDSTHRPEVLRALYRASGEVSLGPQRPIRFSASYPGLAENEDPTSLLHSTREPEILLGYLEELDALSQEKPYLALRLARTVATQVAPQLENGTAQVFARAAGSLATVYRLTGRLDFAAAILRLALLVAERATQKPVIANLYWRAAYVLRDLQRFDDALASIAEAAVIHLRDWDLPQLAKRVADRGIILTDAGRFEEAWPILEEALRRLPKDATLHQVSVYHRLGLCATKLQRHNDAAYYYARLNSLVPRSQVLNRAALLADKAHYLVAAGEHRAAIETFERCRDLLDINPISKATATLELVKVLIKLGERHRAMDEAKSAVFLLAPLAPTIPQISDALDMLRYFISRPAAELSLAKLKHALVLLAEAHRLHSEPQ